jgi:hypothetical protein
MAQTLVSVDACTDSIPYNYPDILKSPRTFAGEPWPA